MTVDVTWMKIRIGDELGLTGDDLARLYGVAIGQLDDHLRSLGNQNQAAYEHLLSDIEGLRGAKRQVHLTTDQHTALRTRIQDHIFRPFVAITMANGQSGWRLSGDDAQFIAYRAADMVNMDFDWSDVLRKRLNRAVIWQESAIPQPDQVFRDRLLMVLVYLVELTGIL